MKRGHRDHTPRQFSELFDGAVTVESEYWLKDSSTCAVVVLTTKDPAGRSTALEAFQTLFSITVLPVVSTEEGLRLLGQAANEPLMYFG